MLLENLKDIWAESESFLILLNSWWISEIWMKNLLEIIQLVVSKNINSLEKTKLIKIKSYIKYLKEKEWTETNSEDIEWIFDNL